MMKRIIAIQLLIGCILFELGNPRNLYIEEGYKFVNGVNHYYKIVGQGEPFIILHGGPGMFHDELYPYFQELAKSNKVIFYDQRGNGKSVMDKIDSSNFTVELMVEDLEALRIEFEIDKLNIIGHSWGGLLAMYYAVTYPDNVKRLILVDAATVNTDLLIKSYKNQITRFTPEEWEYVQKLWNSQAYMDGDPKVHNEAMKLSEGKVFSNKAVIDEYMSVASFNEQTAKNAVALNELSTGMKLNIHVQDQLSKITCPTLLINGKDDFIVKKAPKLAHKLIQNSELVFIEGAGHYPHIEQREIFNTVINEFILKTGVHKKSLYK
jgi:proline iminopeptidase